MTPPPIYNDNLTDRLFIWLFSRKMADALGEDTKLQGYDGFVDLSKRIMAGRKPAQQQQVIAEVLRSLIPAPVLTMIRTFTQPTQLVCELNAWFATELFEWLVGPCHAIDVDVQLADGSVRRQRSGVQIEKCRYLEQSQCVGMCVNMCKVPTQDFFRDDFNIPLTMIPDFEDMSCKMIFGQVPPAPADDAAFHEPCLRDRCDTAAPTAPACPKLAEEDNP